MRILSLLIFLIPLRIYASDPAQVLLLGTFHFRDAGLDTVKVADIDVFEPTSQAFLDAFALRSEPEARQEASSDAPTEVPHCSQSVDHPLRIVRCGKGICGS